MATSLEIKCINKSDHTNIHERIRNVGGSNWKLSQQEAIDGIRRGTWIFYVMKNYKKVNVVIARSAYGNDYLKTEADDTENNNLLSLPECP